MLELLNIVAFVLLGALPLILVVWLLFVMREIMALMRRAVVALEQMAGERGD